MHISQVKALAWVLIPTDSENNMFIFKLILAECGEFNTFEPSYIS